MKHLPLGFISSFTKSAELVLFPSFCKLCSSLLEKPGERIVCRGCLDKIKPSNSSYCLCCGKFFEGVGESHLCGACIQNSPPFSLHRSMGKYQGELKDLILLFKYRHFRVLGRELARLAFKTLEREEGLWWGLEALIPVPLHPKRKKERGFNQAQVLASEFSKLKGVGLLERSLIKVRNVPPQTSLEAKQREKNVRGAYEVRNKEGLARKIVLLVDDVYTTGSTLRECSFILKKAGVKEVRAITLAQA